MLGSAEEPKEQNKSKSLKGKRKAIDEGGEELKNPTKGARFRMRGEGKKDVEVKVEENEKGGIE